MTDINKAILTGRLTADVEVRKTQSGKSVAAFTLASTRRKDDTAFVNCVAWNQSADFLGQYARKGDLINVEGHITTRNYERDGHKVYVTEVVADSVGLMMKKNPLPTENAPQTAQNQPSQPQYAPQYNQPSPEVQMAAQYGLDISSDDLPF